MQRTFLSRRLTYWVQLDARIIADVHLPSLTQPLVILGDAGMGKTWLMNWLGRQPGHRFLTARQLLNRPDIKEVVGSEEVLVIDALDEVAGRNEGDAVDLVLRKLGELHRPRFVISCRAADWRSATGKTAISEVYDEVPLELYLNPLDEEQAREFLSANPAIGSKRAGQIVEQLERRGFADWLGNPQTLLMLEPLLEGGEPPQSTAALFYQYVDRAWKEHNEQKAQTLLNKSSREEVLDALGAAFAALILSNKTAIYRGSSANVRDTDLPLAEVARLPGAGMVDHFVASKLVKIENDRLSYQHRRIGEYLGARWLAKHANTPIRRNRLLSLFRSTGNLVPAHLRGLHAWLAWHDHELADDVFRTDPMGVIEYGDADDLSPKQARALLRALEELSRRNPRFRGWAEYRARGLVQPETFQEIGDILTDQNRPFNLRMTVIEQLDSAELATTFQSKLLELLHGDEVAYAIRHRAGHVLAAHDPTIDFRKQLDELRLRAKSDAVRLAAELLIPAGLEEFSDQQIVEIVLADAGLTICAVPRETVPSRAGRFSTIKHELPPERAEGVLNILSKYTAELMPIDSDIEYNELIDFAYELILDRLASGPVEAKTLWSWLEPYEDFHGYRRDNLDRLSAWFRDHEAERRAVLSYVLLDRAGATTVWERAWRTTSVIPGLAPAHEDIVDLLARLPASRDGRWRDLVRLARHDGEIGREVRDAAQRFARNETDGEAWLREISIARKPEWQIRQEERTARREEERELRWAEHRKYYRQHRTQIRRGDPNFLISPAQAYLGLFADQDEDATPIERLSAWLGDDLMTDVLAGFRVFLHAKIFEPTAEQIAASYAVNRHWRVAHLIVAALAETARLDARFAGIPVDRLIAGRLELEQHGFGRVDHSELSARLDAALRDIPGEYERYLRLLVEPNLKARQTHIPGLYQTMRSPVDVEMADRLAAEWLLRFPRMPADVEEELIDRLIRSGKFAELETIALRRGRSKLDERRARNWRAVRLLTNFDKESKAISRTALKDRDLLWALRARYGGRREPPNASNLPLPLAAWIVGEFRWEFPAVGHPTGGWSGDTNPWDAAEYLYYLISRIGEDVSDDAIWLLRELREQPEDGYSEYLTVVSAEQASKRADQDHRAANIDGIKAIVDDGPPRSVEDLQAVVAGEIDRIQNIIRADDVDSWTGFYADVQKLQPKHEEECSDYLVNLLRQNRYDLRFDPEPHLAGDREGDIGCSAGNLWLPIEAKGQWHPQLWSAPDEQLLSQQASDHRASGRGIYLVYWFGSRGKPLTKPPGALQIPKSPVELERLLTDLSPAARGGSIVVKVLDVSR